MTNVIVQASLNSPLGTTFLIQKLDEISGGPSTVVVKRVLRAGREELQCWVSLYIISLSNALVLLIIRVYISDKALALNQDQLEYLFSLLTLLSDLKILATSIPSDRSTTIIQKIAPSLYIGLRVLQ